MGRGNSLKSVIVALLFIGGFRAQADCSSVLRLPSPHASYSIADGAFRAIRKLQLPAAALRERLDDPKLELIHERNGMVWFIWFVSKGRMLDIGYRVSGAIRGGRLLVTDVTRTDRQDERQYFGAVAADRELPPIRLKLSNAINGCREVVVNGWTQVKLMIKHGLRLSDVQQVLSTPRPEHGKIWEPNVPGRIQWTRTQNGRSIRAILAVDEGCPVTLISAFELY